MSIVICPECGISYELDNGNPCPTCKLLEEPKMNVMVKYEINRLAAKFYRMHGCGIHGMHDFSKSTHPQEQSMWNLALASYIHWNDVDEEMLSKYFIKD